LSDYAIDLAWSPDGTRLAAVAADGPVAVFATADGAKQHELPGHATGANCLAWQPAPAGSLLATGGQDGAVKLWDAAAGQHVATAALGAGWVEHLAWTSPTRLFAVAGRALFALGPEAAIAHRFPPAPKTITALATPAAGGTVATAHFGGVELWDADDFVAQKKLPYGNGIHALAWSPDGKWLVSGNQDPSVHLWIPAEDIELHMSGYEGKVKFLSFDHTSRWLATSGGRDGCVWDCA